MLAASLSEGLCVRVRVRVRVRVCVCAVRLTDLVSTDTYDRRGRQTAAQDKLEGWQDFA